MSKETRVSLADQLAEKIKPLIEIDPKAGTGKLTDEGVFVANLPAEITPELYQQLDNYKVDFGAGLLRAFGEKAVDACLDNKDVQRISMTVPMAAGDKYKVGFDRQGTRPGEKNPETGERTTVTYYASTEIQIDCRADHHVGPVREAKAYVKDYYARRTA